MMSLQKSVGLVTALSLAVPEIVLLTVRDYFDAQPPFNLSDPRVDKAERTKRKTGTRVPALPWIGRDEQQLFFYVQLTGPDCNQDDRDLHRHVKCDAVSYRGLAHSLLIAGMSIRGSRRWSKRSSASGRTGGPRF